MASKLLQRQRPVKHQSLCPSTTLLTKNRCRRRTIRISRSQLLSRSAKSVLSSFSALVLLGTSIWVFTD
ncbi:unnamed protein product [Eruca vesicaria subsp. sativa]|uniref:Uncharacterized protein n=1 Tax=Eruca vesicaria subsp. sativa TaxID=29727 RepID=A0ABC8K2E7_ERUVS|nr:unnamed protein product [Eruca vesicaria subsp. sativa]